MCVSWRRLLQNSDHHRRRRRRLLNLNISSGNLITRAISLMKSPLLLKYNVCLQSTDNIMVACLVHKFENWWRIKDKRLNRQQNTMAFRTDNILPAESI